MNDLERWEQVLYKLREIQQLTKGLKVRHWWGSYIDVYNGDEAVADLIEATESEIRALRKELAFGC